MEAYKYIIDVDNRGQIKIPYIPQIKSSKVEVIILPFKFDDYSDLADASESSLDFWNNEADEVWNHV